MTSKHDIWGHPGSKNRATTRTTGRPSEAWIAMPMLQRPLWPFPRSLALPTLAPASVGKETSERSSQFEVSGSKLSGRRLRYVGWSGGRKILIFGPSRFSVRGCRGGSGECGGSNRTFWRGHFVEKRSKWGPPGSRRYPARGAAGGRGRSTSASRSETARARSVCVGERWRKPCGISSKQRPVWPPGARGRQQTGLPEAGSDVPSCVGHVGRPDTSFAAPPRRLDTYASRSVQHRPSRLRTSIPWSVNSVQQRAPYTKQREGTAAWCTADPSRRRLAWPCAHAEDCSADASSGHDLTFEPRAP